MPIPRQEVAAEVSPRAPPARRPLLTRAARRDIRRASALANELKVHSFRVHVDGTVTWTLKEPRNKDQGTTADSSESLESKPSSRKQRSA